MNARKYRREVLRVLAEEYGVTDARIEPGGSHPKCRFTHGGIERTLTLACSPASDFQTTLKQKLRDVRRLLEGPPVKPDVKWEEMSATPIHYMEEVSVTDVKYDVTVGCYRSPSDSLPRVRIYLPEALRPMFPNGVKVTRIDATTWQLKNEPKRKTPKVSVDGKIQFSGGDLTGDVPAFGSSPGVAVLVDGALLVESPVEKRRGVWSRLPSISSMPITAEVKAPVSAFDEVKSPVFATGNSIDESYLRGVLSSIRRVEAESSYRLTENEESGAWMFLATIE